MNRQGFKHGGIRVRDNSAPAAGKSLIAFLPALSVVPLLQHAGGSCQTLVKAGDYVHEGKLIGRAERDGQANIHAPVPGRVLRIIKWRMPDGRSSDVLVIKLEGAFNRLGKPVRLHNWKSLTPEDLRLRLADKGVVEMEEPGQPVAALLDNKRPNSILLVLRAIFDDPWQAADHTVLGESTAKIAEALVIAAFAARTTTVAVVVTQRDEAIAQHLAQLTTTQGLHCQVIIVHNKYPQHNLREVSAVLKDSDPESFGRRSCVILSPSTFLAIYEAVRLQKPVVERYVAVGGSAVKHPSVLRLRLGTRIGDAFAECGGFVEEVKRVVIGSPITGYAVNDLDTPISKTTSAIVAMGSHQVAPVSIRACIACGACREICPIGLDPERLYKLAAKEQNDQAVAEGADTCYACACCSLVCPSRLPLAVYIAGAGVKGGSHG